MKLSRLLVMAAIMACYTSANTQAQTVTKTPVDMEICTAERYYKGLFARPFYATCTYRYDNIKRIGSHDLTAFHQALKREFGNNTATSPEGFINVWSRTLVDRYPESLTPVQSPGQSKPYDSWYATHAEDMNDQFPYGAPFENASLVFAWYNPEADVVSMTYTSEIDTGGGMGASYACDTTPFYFDLNTNRQVTLDSLFKGSYRSTLLKLVREWVATHADELCLIVEIKDVTLSDRWELRGGNLVFLYSKYEISCGAAGNVSVPVAGYEVSELLTPLGRTLLGVTY